MADAGHKPQRTCLGCRQTLERERLVRYVLSPAGEVLVDYGAKLPGRGAYTHPNRDCIQAAVRSRQFERAFRGRGHRPEAGTLVSELLRQVSGRITSLIGMARKSGQAISGSNLVLGSLATHSPPGLVLLSEDISPGVAGKVRERAERAGVPVFHRLDKDLLGRILGKGERSTAAFPTGPLTTTLYRELLVYEHIAGES